jgi:hypothetical protein
MSLDDAVKYGIIKENIFVLVHGLEARMKASDTQTCLRLEHEVRVNLLTEMQSEVQQLDQDYKELTINVAGVVNDIATPIEDAMATLRRTEEQEFILKDQLEQGRNAVCGCFEKSPANGWWLKEHH